MKVTEDSERDHMLSRDLDLSLDYPLKAGKFLSLRFFISFLCLLGCAVMYMTRNNLNVAIVDMVTTIKRSDNLAKNHSLLNHNDYNQCPVAKMDKNNSSTSGEFSWSPSTQGIVIGSFYYGYVWPQIFGGRLSEIYGAKHLIGCSIFISGLINLMTPTIIRYDFKVFIGSRVVLGLVQGILFPSFMSLLAKWIPHSEHSTFIPWLDVGCTVGTVIVSAGAGHLIEDNVMGGWPSVFYISGIAAILWVFLWLYFITSKPSDHKWITQKELKYILSESESSKHKSVRKSFPWRRILTSRAFISVLVTKLTFGISWDFISAKIPAYLQDVIHFPIADNGLIYSILMISIIITTLGCGYIADAFIEAKQMSKTNVRKLFQTVCGVGTAIPLVMIPSVGCNKMLNVLLLTICSLMMGVSSGGDVPIVVDLTEEYAGTVFAVMNCICSINGFVVPYIVGVFIDANPDSMELWSYLFYFSALMAVIGVIVFGLFSTSEPQHWESSDCDSDYVVLFDKNSLHENDHKLMDKYSI